MNEEKKKLEKVCDGCGKKCSDEYQCDECDQFLCFACVYLFKGKNGMLLTYCADCWRFD